jgi:methylphosphotriester-DNA--protein-cysteine methyltransferase
MLVVNALAQTAVNSGPLTLWSFLACAEALKTAMEPHAPSPVEQAAKARTVLDRAVQRRQMPLHVRVEAVTAMLHSRPWRATHQLGVEAFASEVGGDSGHLGKLLKRQTGWYFHEWRRSPRIKEGVKELVTTSEHVDQIAWHRLGYYHRQQFSRDFRDTAGVSPKRFRELLRLNGIIGFSNATG